MEKDWRRRPAIKPYWILYDSETDKQRFCRAWTQKEAVRKAVENGLVPKNTNHVKPRNSCPDPGIMTQEDFQSYVKTLVR